MDHRPPVRGATLACSSEGTATRHEAVQCVNGGRGGRLGGSFGTGLSAVTGSGGALGWSAFSMQLRGQISGQRLMGGDTARLTVVCRGSR